MPRLSPEQIRYAQTLAVTKVQPPARRDLTRKLALAIALGGHQDIPLTPTEIIELLEHADNNYISEREGQAGLDLVKNLILEVLRQDALSINPHKHTGKEVANQDGVLHFHDGKWHPIE